MKKDIISKELLKEMAKDISRHILKIEILDDMELIDKEFTRVEKRDADLVYKNGNEIVHIEIQNNHHARMHLRMLRYYDDILFQYEKYKVKQYLLYVGKEKCHMQNEIVRDEINYRYAIIDIRDISCESFLKSNDPSAVVLAILCNFEKKDKQEVVNTILRRLIELSEDEVSFRNYLEKVEVFSTNRDLEKEVDKGEKMLAVDIEKLPSFNRGLEKGIKEGIKEGIQTGLDKGIHFVALQMLKMNMEITVIEKATSLTKEEIELLKKEI